MRRFTLLAVAFGAMAVGLATAQQQQPPGGTQPNFVWDTYTDSDGKVWVQPFFPIPDSNLPNKRMMRGSGTLVYYKEPTFDQCELRWQAAIGNNTFPDEEEVRAATCVRNSWIYGQRNSIVGAEWILSGNTMNTDGTYRVFDVGQQVAVRFRVRQNNPNGSSFVISVGNKTVTAG
jgi:hypothetical protein